jgi:TRAP-type mannitol/chloroaromatic compound transport system permease small subunit
MGTAVDRIVRLIDGISMWIGESAKWINLALVVLIFTDVLLRYLISQTQAWIIELEWHFFALIFLFGAAYALKEEHHVRVDVMFAKWSGKRKALIDLIGTLRYQVCDRSGFLSVAGPGTGAAAAVTSGFDQR